MSDATPPRLTKLPFWFADATLLAAAATLVQAGSRPLNLWEVVALACCVALGAWLAVVPYLKEYDATVKLAETDRLADTSAKLGQLDTLASLIAGATAQWQGIQERASRTAELSNGIVDRLAREAESFASAVSRTAESEKQTLKLEVEKLRRGEGEWLQAVGRIMDHVFALHLAAVRSSQPGLAEQMERFHGACRDALRRVGFNLIVASPDELFDPRKHQAVDGARPPEGTRIDETVAPGFVFQGHLLRPIVVKTAGGGAAAPTPAPPAPDSPALPEPANLQVSEAHVEPPPPDEPTVPDAANAS